MFLSKSRALVDHQLRQLLKDGLIKRTAEETTPNGNEDKSIDSHDLDYNFISKYVQPASVDLPLSSVCYLVKDRILPYGRKLVELIPGLEIAKLDLSGDGAVFLKGLTYLVYCGRVKMPVKCRGSLSPKSSIGRVDLMVRGIFDGCGLYDTIDPGKEGDLWMEINPRSFNVRIKEGQALSQMMVFIEEDSNRPTTIHASPEITNAPIIFDAQGNAIDPPPLHHNGAVILHLGLVLRDTKVESNGTSSASSQETKKIKQSEDPATTTCIGWEALSTSEVVDLSKVKSFPASRFFRPIYASLCLESGKNKITLEKDRFYILATKERIRVPTHLSAEMIPFSHHIGELRAHYAGFFDPGFGFGQDGSIKGTVGVLEVRPHETMTIFDGQPICLIEYFQNDQIPEVAYGHAGNSYQNQTGAKLAKYFNEDL